MLENRNSDIILLQETHSTPESSRKWEKEWTGNSIWHSGPTPKNSGVAILIKEKSNIEIISTQKDTEGRIITCTISLEQHLLQLVNVYAPTIPSDRKEFYKNLENVIDLNKTTILACDFNMIENISLDRLGGNPNKTHTIGLENLEKIKNKLNLIDTWRKNNPFQKLFTYHNGDKTIHSRIDRIYISKQIKLIKSQITPNTISDHDSVTTTIQINKKEPKGPGIWKLNTNILTQKDFKKIFETFWKNWQHEKNNYKNHNDWWEIDKIYFKTISIEYCTKINYTLNETYNKLL